MHNIAFPMVAVVGPKVFHPFDDKLINYGYKIITKESLCT